MSQPDPIVILGAGHNGLAAAAYLARSGRRVLVLESRAHLGGTAATEMLVPDFHFNTGFANAAALDRQVVRDLKLEDNGFKPLEPHTAIFAAQPGHAGIPIRINGGLVSANGNQAAAQGIAKLPEFNAFVQRATAVLAAMRPLTPPNVKERLAPSALWSWARVALETRGLGKREMMEFVRVLPMSAKEFLDEWFDDESLKGALGIFATLGAHLGPMGAGTTLILLYHFIGGLRPVFAQGGAGQISAALAKAVEGAGGEIRTGAQVARIRVRNRTVRGVELATGEFIPSSVVASSLDPFATLHHLVGPRHLPVRFARRLNNIRFRGSTATLHFALSGLPDFGAQEADLDGWITMCPGLTALEKAYDDAKYGHISSEPCLLASIPSILDPTLAPDGRHSLSVIVRYAPYHLIRGSWEALPGRVMNTIGRYAENFKDLVIDYKLITPHDYAARYGLTEGAWMHGQLGLDQLLIMRPLPGWSQYKTPISGLFLCGGGSHPGGGISAVPGRNAAREILKSL